MDYESTSDCEDKQNKFDNNIYEINVDLNGDHSKSLASKSNNSGNGSNMFDKLLQADSFCSQDNIWGKAPTFPYEESVTIENV